MFYQNLPDVTVKKQDLLEKKKRKDELSNLSIKTPLSKIPILGDFLF